MKFFIPGVEDAAEAEKLYAVFREEVRLTFGAVDDKRYCSVRTSFKNGWITNVVGEPNWRDQSLVAAIFKSRDGGCFSIRTEKAFQMENDYLATATEFEA